MRAAMAPAGAAGQFEEAVFCGGNGFKAVFGEGFAQGGAWEHGLPRPHVSEGRDAATEGAVACPACRLSRWRGRAGGDGRVPGQSAFGGAVRGAAGPRRIAREQPQAAPAHRFASSNCLGQGLPDRRPAGIQAPRARLSRAGGAV